MGREFEVRLQSATRDFLRAAPSQGIDVGAVLGAGPAGCAQLDRDALAVYEKNGGSVSSKNSVTLLEADWLATTAGLFYVVPRAWYVWWRPWSVLRVEVGKVSRPAARGAEIHCYDGERSLVMKVSRPAANDISDIAERCS